MTRRWRRMMATTLVVLLLPVGFGRLPAASACSCASEPPTTEEQDIAEADVVFDGAVVQRVEPPPGPGDFFDTSLTWRFDVLHSLKGAVTDPQDVVSSSLCGRSFAIGRQYRVYAWRDESGLSTSGCSATRPLIGYRLVATDGGVFAFGAATFHGSAGGLPLVAPVVGIASTPSGRGYWLAAADGGVFAYGDARFFGSAGGGRLNARVVGITATPSGQGYWLAGADGGVFAYGDARFLGSAAGVRLNAPVVDIAATGSGRGYWLLGRDGGVFGYGDAGFFGVPSELKRDAGERVGRATGITATVSGTGYWISDGVGINAGFGDIGPDAPYFMAALGRVVGISRPSGSGGLIVASSTGGVLTYPDGPFGDLTGQRLNAPIVAVSP